MKIKILILCVWNMVLMMPLEIFSQEKDLFATLKEYYLDLDETPKQLHKGIMEDMVEEISCSEYKVSGTLVSFKEHEIFSYERGNNEQGDGLSPMELKFFDHKFTLQQQLKLYRSAKLINHEIRYYREGYLRLSDYEKFNFPTDADFDFSSWDKKDISYNSFILDPNVKIGERYLRLVVLVPYTSDFLQFRKNRDYQLKLRILALKYHGERYDLSKIWNQRKIMDLYCVLQTETLTKEYESPLFQSVSFGTFIDPRDNWSYKTIQINGKTWLAENLSYIVEEGCWAPFGKEEKVEKYGRLYSYKAAQKACPPGWHIPTEAEWKALFQEFGGEKYVGRRLKSKKGWIKGGNGINTIGFEVLPAGERDEYQNPYSKEGIFAEFWTCSPYMGGILDIKTVCFHYRMDNVDWSGNKISNKEAVSLRCVKDD